ncbi:MAG: YidC/Oxa1 family membrane protein insertase [Candidatus Promineifilaceae bacterium]
MWDQIIINPMTNALLLLYDFLGNNFVLAIAIFTVLIRLVTLPLNLRQQKTSIRMQEMQPQIQAIQKKYRDNPAKMQEEFKKIGYNPTESLTGCLPLLLQFPILIGLYRAIIVLLGSTPLSLLELTDRVYPAVDKIVNLSSALPIPNKFLWLNLAQPDPIYILPALVFVTMFVSQKLLSPAKKKEDEQKGKEQKKDDNPMAGMTQSMQYTMPIMFGFFSLSFPAGLSIYFVLSNLIGIGQGYITRVNMAKEREKADMRKNGRIVTTGIPEIEESPKAISSSNGPGSNSKQKKKRASGRKRRSAKR